MQVTTLGAESAVYGCLVGHAHSPARQRRNLLRSDRLQTLRHCVVVGGVRSMNDVTLRRTRLVGLLGWAAVFGRVCHFGM